MQAQNKKQPSRIDILTWGLARLADQIYVFETVGALGGWELDICDSDGDEIPVSLTQEQGRKIEGGSMSALTEMFPDAKDRAAFFARWVTRQFIYRGREEIGGAEVASLEEIVLESHGETVSEVIASTYLKEFAGGFEKLFDRAEQLRVLPSDKKVPVDVQVYLREASKCFIYGRFIACLIVCRSAIEFALRDRLGREGDLDYLIKVGQEELPFTLRPTLHIADEIRLQANKAVHGGAPDSKSCKEMFDKTRGVLTELYSNQDPRGILQAGPKPD